MFKRNEDGSYSFSRRFWVQLVVMGLLICAIGFSTQRTANRTEHLTQETIAYAQQTNDCLRQVVEVLNARTAPNRELDELETQRNDLIDRRFAAWDVFITDLARISTDLPQTERDRQAATPVATYLKEIHDLQVENDKIKDDRIAALEKRAQTPFPSPNCGNNIPGQ